MPPLLVRGPGAFEPRAALPETPALQPIATMSQQPDFLRSAEPAPVCQGNGAHNAHVYGAALATVKLGWRTAAYLHSSFTREAGKLLRFEHGGRRTVVAAPGYLERIENAANRPVATATGSTSAAKGLRSNLLFGYGHILRVY